MNVREIVEEYLKAHGFDGLCDHECACQIGDLAPCSNDNIPNCEPGYQRNCDTCPKKNATDEDGDSMCQVDDMPQEGGWCISTEKLEAQS